MDVAQAELVMLYCLIKKLHIVFTRQLVTTNLGCRVTQLVQSARPIIWKS